MKCILGFLLTFTLCSCITSPKSECKIKIRNLLFDKYTISWGNTFLGETNTRMIKIYNPTDNIINLKGVIEHPDFKISSKTCHPDEWLEKGINIPARSLDSIYFTFYTADTNNLGYYHEEIRFEIDRLEQYQHFVLTANVLEKFEITTGQEVNVPIVETDSIEYDFGKMYEGQKRTTSFLLKNKGKKPLIIRKIETSCGCTVPRLIERVVQPDHSTLIEIEFRARGKSGKQYKTITLYCNDPRQPVVTFTIQCFIQN